MVKQRKEREEETEGAPATGRGRGDKLDGTHDSVVPALHCGQAGRSRTREGAHRVLDPLASLTTRCSA